MVTIDLPKPVEDRIAEKAKDAGLDVRSYICHIVEAHAAKPTLKELSGPVYQQFLASGMTDEELGDWLEKAKRSPQIKDPRLAWIELDYVLKVSASNPAEAKRVFIEVKQRIPTDSPVYPRIKSLEKNYE